MKLFIKDFPKADEMLENLGQDIPGYYTINITTAQDINNICNNLWVISPKHTRPVIEITEDSFILEFK